jgi:sugar O-acyltransferase (sialic acid O-acetyltransferase NeuD family)
MKRVVIFGVRDFAQLAHYYLTSDSDYEVVAFTVSKDFLNANEYLGIPVVPFDNIEDHFPTTEFLLFAPMSANKMNTLRELVYQTGKQKGYSFISYVSSRASVLCNEIGDNCFILEDNTIQPFTKIGNNVILWSGNHIGHHGVIEDNVFFSSHVVLSGHCTVGRNSFLGVNAAVRNNITIGEGTFVAMATCVTEDTEPWSVYVGNPARKLDVRSIDFPM